MKTTKSNQNRKYLTKREIQLAELDILKVFIKFAEENNLTYCLYAGTALGAVRHHGFIPWDDDIDVAMPRPDYNRFAKLVEDGKFKSDHLEVIIPENQQQPLFLFGKIYDKNIQLEAENGVDSNYLWVDIFQLDGLPSGKKANAYCRKLIRKKKAFKRKRFLQYRPNDVRQFEKSKLHRLLAKIRRIPYAMRNYSNMVREFEKMAQKYDFDKSEYIGNNTWLNDDGGIMKKEWLGEPLKVKFEDIKANIFAGYKEYLTAQYGDYMKLPPVEKRVTHSFKAWRITDEEKKNSAHQRNC